MKRVAANHSDDLPGSDEVWLNGLLQAAVQARMAGKLPAAVVVTIEISFR